METGAKPSRLKHMGRGKRPVFHFGMWRRYQNIPFITKDSNSGKKEQDAASDDFLMVIHDSFAREIAALVEYYSPKLWSKQKGWVLIISRLVDNHLNISGYLLISLNSNICRDVRPWNLKVRLRWLLSRKEAVNGFTLITMTKESLGCSPLVNGKAVRWSFHN